MLQSRRTAIGDLLCGDATCRDFDRRPNRDPCDPRGSATCGAGSSIPQNIHPSNVNSRQAVGRISCLTKLARRPIRAEPVHNPVEDVASPAYSHNVDTHYPEPALEKVLHMVYPNVIFAGSFGASDIVPRLLVQTRADAARPDAADDRQLR